MKLECLITSVGYADFLRYTLPENIPHFDDIIVITSPDDKDTQDVCRRNSVDCVKTHAFHENGDPLNKGRAINVGLDHLKGGGWILHIDADIVLPHRFRHMIERAKIETKNVYGADRMNVYGFKTWERLKPKLSTHYQDRWFVDHHFCHSENPDPLNIKMGARCIHFEHGWIPIGYFQLWHSSHGNRYNYKRGAAAGTDVMFPTLWPRENRVLLPEVIVYHLDSEPVHRIGTNWKGRKSQRFGPPFGRPRHHPKHYDDKT